MFPHSTLREVTTSHAQNNLHAPTQILEALRGDAVVVRALHQRTLPRGAGKGFGTCMHQHGRGVGQVRVGVWIRLQQKLCFWNFVKMLQSPNFRTYAHVVIADVHTTSTNLYRLGWMARNTICNLSSPSSRCETRRVHTRGGRIHTAFAPHQVWKDGGRPQTTYRGCQKCCH